MGFWMKLSSQNNIFVLIPRPYSPFSINIARVKIWELSEVAIINSSIK